MQNGEASRSRELLGALGSCALPAMLIVALRMAPGDWWGAVARATETLPLDTTETTGTHDRRTTDPEPDGR